MQGPGIDNCSEQLGNAVWNEVASSPSHKGWESSQVENIWKKGRSQGLELIPFGVYIIKPIKCLQNPRIKLLIYWCFNKKHITALKQWINYIFSLWMDGAYTQDPWFFILCSSSSINIRLKLILMMSEVLNQRKY